MDLLRGLAHELRAPLQTLLGHVDLLRQGAFGELTPEQKEAVDAVGRSAERILEVARDVLQVARIDAGQDEVAAADVALDELLAAEVAEARPYAEKKGLSLELECPGGLVVDSDAPKLARIVTNLLHNAIKYTDEGRVVVRAGPGFIEIEDTGVGIPADKRDAIFDEYVRLDPSQTGSGLGLAIVRRLTQLLGGRLRLESEVGAGTTVRVELPSGGIRG